MSICTIRKHLPKASTNYFLTNNEKERRQFSYYQKVHPFTSINYKLYTIQLGLSPRLKYKQTSQMSNI